VSVCLCGLCGCAAVWLVWLCGCVLLKKLKCKAVADTKWGQGGTAHALGTASVVASEPKTAPPSAVTFLVTGKKFSATEYPQMFHRIS
jgi:putative effector of murein hydrolase